MALSPRFRRSTTQPNYREEEEDDDEYYDDEEVEEYYYDNALSNSPNHKEEEKDEISDKNYYSFYCFSFSCINKSHLEDGNKIIMPASVLDTLMAKQDIEYPMTFKIINPSVRKVSHCGVLEFSAEEGFVYIPQWMMDNMKLEDGETVRIKNTNLAKATFMKIQPHNMKFVMNLSDPKQVLEKILKDFSCLTVGDTIMVNHESQSYGIDIIEAKPNNAISLFETDCEVDFEKPLDYKEPEKIKPKEEAAVKVSSSGKADEVVFKPFTGVSRRLDGKQPEISVVEKRDSSTENRNLKSALVGSTKRACSVVFDSDDKGDGPNKRQKTKVMEDVKESTSGEKKFQPFTGKKYTLSSY